jgi:WD40 repeat protein
MLGEQAVSLNKKAETSEAPSAEVVAQKGHSLEVAGIFVDMLGVTMVSCGYDGSVCFWDFNTQELVHRVDLGTPQVLLQGFRDASFFAVAGQDKVIRLFDMNTYKLSRRFAGGHSREITDLAFSPGTLPSYYAGV